MDVTLSKCVMIAVGAALVGLVLGYGISRSLDARRNENARTGAERIKEDARREADNIRTKAELEAKEDLFRRREELNREMDLARGKLTDQERRLDKREDMVEQKHDAQLKREKTLDHTERKLKERRAELEKKHQEAEAHIAKQAELLHQISGFNREQAEKVLLERLEHELAAEVAGRIQRHEENLKAIAEDKARRILATAIHRYAAEHTADTTVSTVDIPSDDMKGRIIGREGRNIRTFEKCTGVDVIVDDTPGVVIVSAFDNVRRETARLS